MPAYQTNLKAMLAIWNTPDPDERREMAKATMEHNVHFVDPRHNIIGRDAFLKMVADTRAAFSHAIYRHNSRIEMQNNFCRHHWAIDMDGERVMDGLDITEVNDAGKVVKVIGFFGRLDADD